METTVGIAPKPTFAKRHAEGWLIKLDKFFVTNKITEDGVKYAMTVQVLDYEGAELLP